MDRNPSNPRNGMGARGHKAAPWLRRALPAVAAVVALCGAGGLLVVLYPAQARPQKAAASLEWEPPPPATSAPSTTLASTPTTLPKRPIPIPADAYAQEQIKYIGTISIPKIGVSEPMYDGVTLWNIDKGPSHWPGTPYPGQTGNAVIAGHRVTHTHPFLHIDQLQPGDQVIFNAFGFRSVYIVTSHEIVAPTDTAIANPTPNATATLYSCHPPHSAAYRYVVHLVLQSGPVKV